MTASGLIGIAFEEYCLEVNPQTTPHHFSSSTELIHRTMYRLTQEYSDLLYPLKDLHFAVMGAYPYSSDLYTVLWILTCSHMLVNVWTTNGKSWMERSICPDSQKFLTEWKEKAFEDDSIGLKHFKNFAKDLGDALLLN
ncbi:hypothetical protein KJ836_01370 [Patescibacteria group bacterium]|nr:hypothetical protein [Patescibacteria group bacterium]